MMGEGSLKKVLIIAPYTLLPGETGFNRFHYLATELVYRGHDVTLLTSNFIHPYKNFRNKMIENQVKYKLVLISEKGYKHNFSLRRIISHMQLERNIKEFVENMTNIPDVIYCAYPLMNTAFNVGRYSKKNKIPYILDIQDIWPDSFNVVFNLPNKVFSFLVFPFTLFANKIYSMADHLIAVSNTYLSRAQKFSKNSYVVFIGADLEAFDKKGNQSLNKNPNEIWLTYIGTLSYSYDLITVIRASVTLKNKGYSEIKVKILGEGPDKELLKKEALELGAPVEFLGYQDYKDMARYLCESDIALNSLSKNSQGSITNKLGDYLAAGLPILNSGTNNEVINLIKDYHLGLNYNSGDKEMLVSKIEYLLNHRDKMVYYGLNSRQIAEKKFDRKNTYKKIFQIIEET